MRAVLYSLIARVLGFVPQTIAALLTNYLIIEHFGVKAFSSFALILTVLTLIPANNLGAGAPVTQSVAAYGVDDERSTSAALTGARIYTVSALVTAVAAIVLAAAHLWPVILGGSSGSNAYVGLAVVIYALGFVPSLSQSVLLGTGRNHVLVALQALTSVITAALIWVLVATGAGDQWIVVVPSTAMLVINLAAMGIGRRTARFHWFRIYAQIPFRRRFPGARTRTLAGPMMIVTLATPLAFVADRIILSQVSTSTEVARYALVLQIFGPVTGLIVAGSQPLWPIFTRARAAGHRGPGLTLLLAGFAGGTIVASLVIVFVADPLGGLISDHKISLGLGLPALAAAFTLAQAVAFPLSMSMVDPRGIRVVATTTVISIPANIGLSIYLARQWGAAGPLFSGLMVGIFVMIIPWLAFQLRRSGQQIEVV